MSRTGIITVLMLVAAVFCVLGGGWVAQDAPLASWLVGGGVLLGLASLVSLAMRPVGG